MSVDPLANIFQSENEPSKFKHYTRVFFSPAKIRMITELNDVEITDLNNAELIYNFVKQNWHIETLIKFYVENYCKLKISYKRGSRKEGENVFKFPEMAGALRLGLTDKMLGLKP